MKSLAGVRRRVADLEKKLKSTGATEEVVIVVERELGESSEDAMNRQGHDPALLEDENVLVIVI